MADESNIVPPVETAETDAAVSKPAGKKRSSPGRQQAAGAQVKAAAAKTSKQRKHSEHERAEKLRQIETQVAEGSTTIRDAIKSAGISEQTYYHWKKIAEPVGRTAGEVADDVKERTDSTPITAGDDLQDLLLLEAENQRLRKLLAEKLRAENTELRKRLGME